MINFNEKNQEIQDSNNYFITNIIIENPDPYISKIWCVIKEFKKRIFNNNNTNSFNSKINIDYSNLQLEELNDIFVKSLRKIENRNNLANDIKNLNSIINETELFLDKLNGIKDNFEKKMTNILNHPTNDKERHI
jgi:hypothetical protein